MSSTGRGGAWQVLKHKAFPRLRTPSPRIRPTTEQPQLRLSYDGSMRYGLFIVMGGFAALATTVGSHAHHSITGQYDPRAAVTVKGIVLEVRIRNPHSQMRLEVVDAAGRTEVWALEMDDVADLAEQGVTSKTLRAGDKLVIFGFPARDGSRLLHVEWLHRPSDGLKYEDD